jgi:16S rRNA (uracil1498-N3)-methyltransferase
MHRFHCNSGTIVQDRIILKDKGQVHHARDVLRLNPGDEVAVFDEKGNEYICLIIELTPDEILLQIKNKRKPKAGEVKITIACAIPKKSKMDEIIDKLTQLGVDRIIPLETERVIVKLDNTKKAERLKRWEKIALSASQQSQRSNVPDIEPIQGIKEVLSKSRNYDLKLIPTLEGSRKTLKEIFVKAKAGNILVLIGPEGDFTDEEVALAKKSGCIPITLGQLVLRVDTAAIAVASFIRLYENS